VQQPTQGIREPGELLDVDVVPCDNLRLKSLDLNRESRRLPNEDLARLAQLVLAAEVVGKAIATSR
jgi:hypothetical protein